MSKSDNQIILTATCDGKSNENNTKVADIFSSLYNWSKREERTLKK